MFGMCVEGVQIECWFGRELDGSVVFEQWSVWVTPNEECNPWCEDMASYGDAARRVRELRSYGFRAPVAEGPFPVLYTELGSRAEPSGVAPEGLAFESRHGAVRDYAGSPR